MFKSMLIIISFVAVTFLSTTAFAGNAAKDAVAVDPAHYTVEFENDRVRVIRVKYGPGEKSVMHTHGPNLAVFLTDSTIRMNAPDGTHENASTKTGATQWADSEEHLPENLGDGPIEVILVELKD